MEDPDKRQTSPFEVEGHRRWLTEYLDTRARLASLGSTFQCDPACARPGCRKRDVQIPVSLIDVLGVAGSRREPVSEIYRRHYYLGLFAEERTDWLRRVTLRLQKPCPFLEGDRCGVYPARPLPCMLFPEYLVSRGTLEAQAGKEQFKDYLCLRNPLQLSPERTRIVAKLSGMNERELLLSGFYLFNHGACYLDLSTIVKEGLQGTGGTGNGAPKERLEPPPSLANQELEDFFQECVAGHPPFAGVGERISHLDNQEGQAQFLRLFQDERLFRRLRQDGDDRVLVFRFKKGKLTARRRGIIPTEYKFS
jgi:Fe-S-cluster containining protein